MEQVKFFKLAILGLVLLNVCVVGFLLLSKPKPPHRPTPGKGIRYEITDIFNFSVEQTKSFHHLADEHHKTIKSIEERQKTLASKYFEGLTHSMSDVDKQEIITELQSLEGNKIEETYLHLEEIKELLDEGQQVHFQEFMDKVSQKILGSQKKGPPKSKD